MQSTLTLDQKINFKANYCSEFDAFTGQSY